LEKISAGIFMEADEHGYEGRHFKIAKSDHIQGSMKTSPRLHVNALLHTLTEAGIELGREDINGLMKAYDRLSTFPDVLPALKTFSINSNMAFVVFSNGTRQMISNSVA
jgi:hypothetical protein